MMKYDRLLYIRQVVDEEEELFYYWKPTKSRSNNKDYISRDWSKSISSSRPPFAMVGPHLMRYAMDRTGDWWRLKEP